jgi:hypothetical protein
MVEVVVLLLMVEVGGSDRGKWGQRSVSTNLVAKSGQQIKHVI